MSSEAMAKGTIYQPTTAHDAFERIRGGVAASIAAGDFLDDWRRLDASARRQLIEAPLAEAGDDPTLLRWAAYFAAMVEQLCFEESANPIAVPSWVGRPAYRLARPWFLLPGWQLRAWMLVTTPPAFRARNIFGGDNMLSRA